MFKIKFLILLFSITFLVSCSMQLDNSYNRKGHKFSVDYLSGGKNAFIFKNILTQQMIANNLFNENSPLAISISISVDEKYLSTSITKVASRELNGLSVTINGYKKDEEDCTFHQNTYEADQSFLIAESSANLSNIAAQDDILIINSTNISFEIIDDLLSYRDIDC